MKTLYSTHFHSSISNTEIIWTSCTILKTKNILLPLFIFFLPINGGILLLLKFKIFYLKTSKHYVKRIFFNSRNYIIVRTRTSNSTNHQLLCKNKNPVLMFLSYSTYILLFKFILIRFGL